MGIKNYKPTSNGRRFGSSLDWSEITATKPEKSLLVKIKKTGGRNNFGRITSRHRGGGHKPKYRKIDFRRDKDDIPARVATIEYDPNRSANIALLHYRDGEKRYILAPKELQVGQEVVSGENCEPRSGNCMPLSKIPTGLPVHNIELRAGQGGLLVRSAGMSAQLMAKDGMYATVSLPSGEIRMIHINCRATIGQIGNLDHQNVNLGKAGRKRWMGVRPKVRGTVMNPVAHPMGGGEGKSSGGRHPCGPSGVLSKGGKTRDRRKLSNKHIVRRRKRKRR